MEMHSRAVVPAGIPVGTVGLVTEARALTCGELLASRRSGISADSSLLEFGGVNGRDVYNISAPFNFAGQRMIAGRVERRCDEVSETMLFHLDSSRWLPAFTSPMLASLQDPCVSVIGGELVIGGVRYPVRLANGANSWQMEFFRLVPGGTLRRFLVGPPRMKDIRLCELEDGRVGVFSRPQGARGGRGKIGFAVADSLDDITSDLIDVAPLLPNQFAAGEWGGANEAQLLPDGSLGVLGHIACWDMRRRRHYYSMAFTLDPLTLGCTPVRIIARRDDFPDAPSKRGDLEDVVFSGGLARHNDGTATLYAGLSDAAAGCVRIADPFM